MKRIILVALACVLMAGCKISSSDSPPQERITLEGIFAEAYESPDAPYACDVCGDVYVKYRLIKRVEISTDYGYDWRISKHRRPCKYLLDRSDQHQLDLLLLCPECDVQTDNTQYTFETISGGVLSFQDHDRVWRNDKMLDPAYPIIPK